MSSRLTKKSLVSASGFVVKTPCFAPPALAPSTRRPPTSTVISGAVSVRSCALSTSSCLGRYRELALEVVAEAVGDRLEHREGLDVRLRPARRPCVPGLNGTFTATPAFFAACSTPAQPASTIRSASDTFLPPLAFLLKSRLDALERLQHLRQLRRLVDFPVLLRREADARAVGAAALVGAAEGGGRRPGRRHELRDRQLRGEDLLLEVGDLLLADQLVIDRGNRVLPDQLFLRHFRARGSGRAGPCRGASA